MVNAVAHWLLMLSGYDRNVVVLLKPADVAALTLSSVLCFVSAGMYAAAASYLAYIAVYADSARWPISIGIGVGVLIFAGTMQRLYVTTGGYAHHWDQERLAEWRPDKLRLVCVFIIASLLSLPFVLMRNHDQLEQQIELGRTTKVAFYRDQLHKARQANQQELTRARALVAEREQQAAASIAGRSPLPSAAASLTTGHRKALLIGAQRYQHTRPAPGVGTDLQLLQRALSGAGFATTLSLDETGDKLRLRIDAYLKSLAPGDISVVYYGGRASQYARHNFLLPVDYHAERNTNRYPVAQLIDDLVKTAPQLNAVIFDVASWQDSDVAPMLAPVRSAPHSVILMRTAARRPGVAKPLDGGPLAVALAHQITPSADLRQALGHAAEEVSSRPASSTTVAQQVTLVYGTGFGPGQPPPPATQAASGALAGPAAVQTTICPSTAGPALQRCLRAYMQMFDDRLDALKYAQAEDDIALGQYQQSLARSSMLRERWKLLWKDPAVSVQVVLVVLAMMLGDLLRDLRAGPLRRYEQLRAKNARDAVETAYVDVRTAVGDMLASCPAGPFPGLRWHERTHYFGAPSGAWLSLGGIVAPRAGSDAEFRQALGLSGQAVASVAPTTQSETTLRPELSI
jgi:hypothetical protein